MDLKLQLQELRLKALQSLKRPHEKDREAAVDIVNNSNNNLFSNNENVTLDKEEGEISDPEPFEKIIPSKLARNEAFWRHDNNNNNNSNSLATTNSTNYLPHSRYLKYPQNAAKKKLHRPNSWTRDTNSISTNASSLSFIDFLGKDTNYENLKDIKMALLSKLDVNRSIRAAAEDNEQDIFDQLRECQDLQIKCEHERLTLEGQLDHLNKMLQDHESLIDDVDYDVEEIHDGLLKKLNARKMLKETYMRSLSRFPSSKLFKIYCQILELDEEVVSACYSMHDRIDVSTPFCSVELMDGSCQFQRKTCAFQHFSNYK